MKPQRGTLEENELTFVALSRDGELIVEDTSGKQEVWFRNDHTSSYGLIYKGHVYEFARSQKKSKGVAQWTSKTGWRDLTPEQAKEESRKSVSRLLRSRYEHNPPLIKPSFGSVSTGTLKDDDLIGSFVWELEHLYRGHRMPPEVKGLVQAANAWLEDPEQPDDTDLVGGLSDALNNLALSYTYFGSLEGDGADFGFWPDIEQLERAAQDGEVLKLDAGDEPPNGYRGEVMYVNDHGNVTFGYIDGRNRFRELWSVV